jgi:hypothetical protein
MLMPTPTQISIVINLPTQDREEARSIAEGFMLTRNADEYLSAIPKGASFMTDVAKLASKINSYYLAAKVVNYLLKYYSSEELVKDYKAMNMLKGPGEYYRMVEQLLPNADNMDPKDLIYMYNMLGTEQGGLKHVRFLLQNRLDEWH